MVISIILISVRTQSLWVCIVFESSLSYSLNHYKYKVGGTLPPSQPIHSNHLHDREVAQTLIWLPGNTFLICTFMGKNPLAPAQLPTKFPTTQKQYRACFVCWRAKMKKQSKKKKSWNANMRRHYVSHVIWQHVVCHVTPVLALISLPTHVHGWCQHSHLVIVAV